VVATSLLIDANRQNATGSGCHQQGVHQGVRRGSRGLAPRGHGHVPTRDVLAATNPGRVCERCDHRRDDHKPLPCTCHRERAAKRSCPMTSQTTRPGDRAPLAPIAWPRTDVAPTTDGCEPRRRRNKPGSGLRAVRVCAATTRGGLRISGTCVGSYRRELSVSAATA
jgi:hypothetical protein